MPRRNQGSSSKTERPKALTQRQKKFAETYSKTGNVTLTATLCGIARHVHYGWLKRERTIAEQRDEAVDDYPYHSAWSAAREESLELLEAEARRRAERGVKKYKFYGGKPVIHPETGEPYFEMEYDTALLMFLLKALHPEKYRDRSDAWKNRDALSDRSGQVVVYVPDNQRPPPTADAE